MTRGYLRPALVLLSLAALVLALALDQSWTAPEPEPVREAVVPPSPPLELTFETQLFVDPPADRPSVVTAPVAPGPRVRASVLASALVDVGALPGMEAGVRLGLGLDYDALIVELEGSYLSASRAASSQPGASVELVLAYGTLRGGARWRALDWLALGGAGELEVGAASGTGAGVRLDQASSATLPWLALRLALFIQATITSVVGVRLSASIGTPLVAPSFEVDGVGSVFTASAALVQGALTLVVHLS